MKRKKKKEVFILYEYEEFEKDFEIIAEYETLKELKEKNKEEIQLENDRSIYHYIEQNINDVKHLLNDKYIIIKEYIWKYTLF